MSIKLRMRSAKYSRENDPDGSPPRYTVALERAEGSDSNDDNMSVNASNMRLELHGAHKPGWSLFTDGGDFIVTIKKAPPLEPPPPPAEPEPEPEPEKPTA